VSRLPYLIIGNSAAAMGAVEGIRSVDPDRPITIVARESQHTYSRPLISYLLARKVGQAHMFYRDPDFYQRNNVRAMLGVEVVRVEPDERAIETSDGRRLPFEKLLIATGGRPLLPGDVPGVASKGVFTFTTWDDVTNIEAYIEQTCVRRAVVVGGGLIGLKATEAFVELGIKTAIVELADHLLGTSLDQTSSKLVTKQLEDAGIAVHCGDAVSTIEHTDERASGVALRSGTKIPCDLVILAIGVAPNTDCVRGSDVAIARGIVVDNTMQTSVAGIYAAGDVAQAPQLLSSEKRAIPVFPNACRQGYVAGANMAGSRRIYKGSISMNSVDVFGLPAISIGIACPDGDGYEVLSDVNEERRTYKKVVLRDEKVVGAIFVGQIDRAGIVTGLIREGITVSDFKDLLLTEGFGLICLPAEYRKHMVSGLGIEV